MPSFEHARQQVKEKPGSGNETKDATEGGKDEKKMQQAQRSDGLMEAGGARAGRCRRRSQEGGEVSIPTLPCCYLAPSLWTGLVWAGLCCLAGAGRPRTTRLKRGGEEEKSAEREKMMGEYKRRK